MKYDVIHCTITSNVGSAETKSNKRRNFNIISNKLPQQNKLFIFAIENNEGGLATNA